MGEGGEFHPSQIRNAGLGEDMIDFGLPHLNPDANESDEASACGVMERFLLRLAHVFLYKPESTASSSATGAQKLSPHLLTGRG